MFIIIALAKIVLTFCIGYNIGYYGVKYLESKFI